VATLPSQTQETARRLLLDVAGLCIAARHTDYVAATLASVDGGGACTALGHPGGFDAFGAALVNGTAAHGEDFDDTFEGGPVHAGAVVVPAVLAACERERLGGDRLLVGIVTGAELMCRLSLVAPKATHAAGFHPTAVFGALAAAGGVSAALRLPSPAIASALGIAGSMAAGIIEYLAEGASTKRMHAGWAAQSGVRAALMARGGFIGPRTVLEGQHGFYRAFAPSVKPDFEPLQIDLGRKWLMQQIAFKPYACGTMTQPFVDCAIELAQQGVTAEDIEQITCDVGEGTVHRLWEPLAVKHRPPTPYAAKFSTPYCMAVGFFDRRAGFAQFTESRVNDESVLALAGKILYSINPRDEYPRNFTGHLRATLKDGSQREIRRPHMRGGVHAPLSSEELEAKFMDNVVYGGWSCQQGERFRTLSRGIFSDTTLNALMEFRS
jgi:2-methylcitrate dehydratase PrpD